MQDFRRVAGLNADGLLGDDGAAVAFRADKMHGRAGELDTVGQRRFMDMQSVEALSAELEGILLWCLEGLQRLLRNSYKFTVSPKAAANLETIKRNSNNVLDFLDSEGYFRYKANFSISSKDLYEIYKLWCEDNACHPVSAARLSSEVSQNAVRLNLEPTNNIYLPGGRRVRGFMGIEALVHPAA